MANVEFNSFGGAITFASTIAGQTSARDLTVNASSTTTFSDTVTSNIDTLTVF